MSRRSAFLQTDRRAEPAGTAAKAVCTLSEVFAGTVGDAGAAGFVLSQLPGDTAPILWIQDRLSRRETGRPYLPGLGLARPLLLMEISRPADVLAAAEEGLRCKALSAVVAEVMGDPPALDFTATKRLAFRAEAAGLPCWLIRHGGTADLSAARDRWRVASLPSLPLADDPGAPGDPRWRVELFRSRSRQPGLWVAHHDWAAHRLDLVPALPDGAEAAAGRPAGQFAAG